MVFLLHFLFMSCYWWMTGGQSSRLCHRRHRRCYVQPKGLQLWQDDGITAVQMLQSHTECVRACVCLLDLSVVWSTLRLFQAQRRRAAKVHSFSVFYFRLLHFDCTGLTRPWRPAIRKVILIIHVYFSSSNVSIADSVTWNRCHGGWCSAQP